MCFLISSLSQDSHDRLKLLQMTETIFLTTAHALAPAIPKSQSIEELTPTPQKKSRNSNSSSPDSAAHPFCYNGPFSPKRNFCDCAMARILVCLLKKISIMIIPLSSIFLTYSSTLVLLINI